MTTRAEIQQRKREARLRFAAARKAEMGYMRSLVQVSRQVGNIIRGFAPNGQLKGEEEQSLILMLENYSNILKPWAKAVALRMIADVERRDAAAWRKHSREMGNLLAEEMLTKSLGDITTKRLNEQIDLITSLPKEAAARVHKLAMEARLGGKRPEEVARMIKESYAVSESRAKLIARTEVARTATEITRTRSENVGSTHYIWRTAGDADVRETHAKLDGKTFAWDSPPVSGENGERSHPGSIYNCRCFAEPIIPD